MNNINKRIKQLRNALRMSQEAFGEKLGVSRSMINNYERNITTPKPPFINLMVKTYNVSKSWLLEGTGNMFYEEVERDPIEQLQKTYAISDKAIQIIKNFIQLPHSKQEDIIDTVTHLFNIK